MTSMRVHPRTAQSLLDSGLFAVAPIQGGLTWGQRNRLEAEEWKRGFWCPCGKLSQHRENNTHFGQDLFLRHPDPLYGGEPYLMTLITTQMDVGSASQTVWVQYADQVTRWLDAIHTPHPYSDEAFREAQDHLLEDGDRPFSRWF